MWRGANWCVLRWAPLHEYPPHAHMCCVHRFRMLSRGSTAVATMAALSTACRAVAFVPTFTSNAAIVGSGRARQLLGPAAAAAARRSSSSSSSSISGSLGVTPERRTAGDSRRRHGVRMMMMSSSAQDTAEVETLTASIKAKGDEIRRSAGRGGGGVNNRFHWCNTCRTGTPTSATAVHVCMNVLRPAIVHSRKEQAMHSCHPRRQNHECRGTQNQMHQQPQLPN